MSRLEALLEGERRGILDTRSTELLAEARHRGFTPKKEEPTGLEAAGDAVMSGFRGFNRGVADMVSLPYRAIDWAQENTIGRVTGDLMPNNEDNPYWNYYRKPEKPKTKVGEYMQAGGEAVGASVLPVGIVAATAPKLASMAATSVPKAIAQLMGKQAAKAPAATTAMEMTSAATGGMATEKAKQGGMGPGMQAMAGLAGAMGPTALVSGGRAIGNISRRVSEFSNPELQAYRQIKKQMPDLNQLSDDIAVGSARSNKDINRRALDYLGEEMVRHGGDKKLAATATVSRIAKEANVTPETAQSHLRRVINAHQENELFFAEYPAVAQSNAAQRMSRDGNIDVRRLGQVDDTPSQETIDYLANSAAGKSVSNVRNAISGRHSDTKYKMRAFFEKMLPNGQDVDDAEAFIAQSFKVRSGDYSKAIAFDAAQREQGQGFDFSQMINAWNSRLNRLQNRNTPIGKKIQQAVGLFLRDDGTPIQSLREFIERRANINQMIDDSMNTGRATTLTRELIRFKTITDRIVGRKNPLWREVNKRWAETFSEEDALKLGQSLTDTPGPRQRQALQRFATLAPEAQDMLRIGFLQRLFDKLDKLGDMHSVVKLFAKDSMRNVVTRLFGRRGMLELEKQVRDMKVMQKSFSGMSNSATHRRDMTQGAFDADVETVAAVRSFDLRGLRELIVEKLTAVMLERRNQPLAAIATTPMSNTHKVAEHLHRMRNPPSRTRPLRMPQSRIAPLLAPWQWEN